VLLAGLLGGGILARGLHALGVLPLPELAGFASWAVPALAAIELYRVLRTVTHHVRRRQIRNDFRLSCDALVSVTASGPEGQTTAIGQLNDVTTGGAGMYLDEGVPATTPVTVAFSVPDARGGLQHVRATATVTTCRPAGAGYRLGVRFDQLNPEAHQAIVEYCYVVSTFQRRRGGRLPGHPQQHSAEPATLDEAVQPHRSSGKRSHAPAPLVDFPNGRVVTEAARYFDLKKSAW
jgi:hypothetical protein